MSRTLKGKVAVVTGASSGIGRDTVLALADEGAVVVAASRNQEVLELLEREKGSVPGTIIAFKTDVTQEAEIDRLVQETLKRFGTIDILVCSAGVYFRRPIRETTIEQYEQVMDVNFYGSVRPILKVLPCMLERRSGNIIAVSTIDGKKGLPPDGVYVASKFALTGFMDVLRQELRGSGVSATTILPGRVDTPMIAHLNVPLASAKISSRSVARAIIRALRRPRAEVIIPYPGPKLLVVLGNIWAPLGDWIVRVLKLEGKEVTR